MWNGYSNSIEGPIERYNELQFILKLIWLEELNIILKDNQSLFESDARVWFIEETAVENLDRDPFELVKLAKNALKSNK